MYHVDDVSPYGSRIYYHRKLLLSVHACPDNKTTATGLKPDEAEKLARYLAKHFNDIEEKYGKSTNTQH